MVKLDIYITKKQKAILEALRKREGLSLAEHIRRAIDNYIKELKSDYEYKLESAKESS